MNRIAYYAALISMFSLHHAQATDKKANAQPNQMSIIADLKTSAAPLLLPPLWKIVLEYRGSEQESYHTPFSIPIAWASDHTFSIARLNIITHDIRYWNEHDKHWRYKPAFCIAYSLATSCHTNDPLCECNDSYTYSLHCLEESFTSYQTKKGTQPYIQSTTPLSAQSADGRFTVTTVEEKSPFHTMRIIDHNHPTVDSIAHKALVAQDPSCNSPHERHS